MQNISKTLSEIDKYLNDIENVDENIHLDLIDNFQYYKKINKMYKPWGDHKIKTSGYLFFNLNDDNQLHGNFKIFKGCIDNLTLYIEGSYNNCEYSGMYKEYFNNDCIIEYEYNCETGEVVNYSSDGSKYYYAENYISNKYNGVVTYYDEDGIIKYSKYYKDNQLITKSKYVELKGITKQKKLNNINKFFE